MRAYPPVREMTPAERKAQRDRVERSTFAERATTAARKGHCRTFTMGLLGAMGDQRQTTGRYAS
jgi:hypothetical protein